MVNRYVEEMTREALVEEIKGFIKCGVFAPSEVGDPTILPVAVLRRGLKRLRLRVLIDGRPDADAGPAGLD